HPIRGAPRRARLTRSSGTGSLEQHPARADAHDRPRLRKPRQLAPRLPLPHRDESATIGSAAHEPGALPETYALAHRTRSDHARALPEEASVAQAHERERPLEDDERPGLSLRRAPHVEPTQNRLSEELPLPLRSTALRSLRALQLLALSLLDLSDGREGALRLERGDPRVGRHEEPRALIDDGPGPLDGPPLLAAVEGREHSTDGDLRERRPRVAEAELAIGRRW